MMERTDLRRAENCYTIYSGQGRWRYMENNSISNAERNGKGVKFERIRRITGYLVGTVDRWNDAKKAELNDRVKHA